jgi:hypothetical protein
VEWRATADHQTTDHALYRLGGDASSGISALVVVSLPGYGAGGWVRVVLDVGIAKAEAVSLGEVAALFRDALMLTTAMVPEVLEAMIPPEAQASRAEIHMQSFPRDPNGNYAPGSPQLSLLERVDLSSLGESPPELGLSWGFAAQVAGPLAENEAGQLVVDGIEEMALAHGYVRLGAGLTMLKGWLGLPTI